MTNWQNLRAAVLADPAVAAEYERLKAPAVHVTPLNDLIDHDETGGALCKCVCVPEVELGGGILVIHNAIDGRK